MDQFRRRGKSDQQKLALYSYYFINRINYFSTCYNMFINFDPFIK